MLLFLFSISLRLIASSVGSNTTSQEHSEQQQPYCKHNSFEMIWTTRSEVNQPEVNLIPHMLPLFIPTRQGQSSKGEISPSWKLQKQKMKSPDFIIYIKSTYRKAPIRNT